MFSDTKLVDLNVQFHIKDHILFSTADDSPSFDEQVEDESLILAEDPTRGIAKKDHKLYQSGNRSWLYYDLLQCAVTVKKNGYEISPAEYTVNYNDGQILFRNSYAASLDDADLISASYSCLMVQVIDSFPYGLLTNESNYRLPVVSVEYINTVPFPFELGGTQLFRRSFSINVLANSDPQRDDIVGAIAKGIRPDTMIIDYRQGMPLLYNGSKNDSFTASVTKYKLAFTAIRDRVIRKRKPLPNERFWGLVTFLTESFV